jgi:hypothetical protein
MPSNQHTHPQSIDTILTSIVTLQVLQQSTNPIMDIVLEYGADLNDVYKAALQAAAGVNLTAEGRDAMVMTANEQQEQQQNPQQQQQQHVVTKLFQNVVPDLEKLDASMVVALKELSSCEELANNMIVVKGTGDISDSHFRRSLTALFAKFGEIQAIKLWVDVQLTEYRTIFSRAEAMGISSIPQMLEASAAQNAYNEAVRVLTSVTGRTVEAGSRFQHLKDRCQRYDIASGFDANAGGIHGAGDQVSFEGFLNLQAENESLRGMLREAEEESEELNLEVFRVMQEKDRTPGALMFFSTLQDPVTTSVMAQMSLQLGKLKAFSEGEEHIDFGALRKRLQVCISCVPTVDRFVQRYQALHKKWSTTRLASFMNRGLTGGASDSANLCPMCNNDPAKTLAPSTGVGKTTSSSSSSHSHRLGVGGPHTNNNPKGKGNNNAKSRRNKVVANLSHSHSQQAMAMTDSVQTEGSLPAIKMGW